MSVSVIEGLLLKKKTGRVLVKLKGIVFEFYGDFEFRFKVIRMLSVNTCWKGGSCAIVKEKALHSVGFSVFVRHGLDDSFQLALSTGIFSSRNQVVEPSPLDGTILVVHQLLQSSLLVCTDGWEVDDLGARDGAPGRRAHTCGR